MNSAPSITAHWRLLMILGLSLISVSCSSLNQASVGNPLNSRAWWQGDGIAGKPKLVINLSMQRVLYYKGGQLVGVSPISSGRENHGTVTGSYHIMDKDLEHRSSLFGAYADKDGNLVQEDVDTRTDASPQGSHFIGASMRYFMRIVGGIGMHEGYLPGYPASHGCIRLPTKMAVIFFRETPEGTPVEIIGESALAANEAAIPIGVDKIEDTPEVKAKSSTGSAFAFWRTAAAPPAAKVQAEAPRPAAAKVGAPTRSRFMIWRTVETAPAAKVKVAARPAAKVATKVETRPAPKVASSKKAAEPKPTVRRAIIAAPKSRSGSPFHWWNKPPPGTTIYLQR